MCVRAIIAAFLAVTLSQQALTATLVAYDFSSDLSQTEGDATGTNLVFGSFFGVPTDSNTPYGYSGSTAAFFVRSHATGPTTEEGDELSEAIGGNAYASITLTNTTGSDVELGEFNYNYWATDSSGEPTDYTSHLVVDGNADGFDVGDALGSSTILPPPPLQADALNVTYDISSLGTLGAGDSLEFRLYFTDTSTETELDIHRVDNISITTLEPIPEPSTVCLLLAGLGGLLGTQYKRR